MQEKGNKSCLSCKLISVGCLLGIGTYLLYQGRVQSKYKTVYFSLGTATACLGIGEIFDKSPFRSVKNAEEN